MAKRAPGASGNAGTSIESGISALKGRGEPLSGAARAYFEPRFGADFSKVRVHTGPRAHEAASSINARAFTLGSDIAFARGEYTPGTENGRKLIAHELTHVIQQHNKSSKFAQRKELHLYDPADNFLRRWGYAKHYCANYSLRNGMCLKRKPGKLHAAIYGVADIGRKVRLFKGHGHKINAIIFHTHGSAGYVHLSKDGLDITNVGQLSKVSGQLERNAKIEFMGCNVAEGKKGLRFIKQVGYYLLRVGGGTVCASDSTAFSIPIIGHRGPLWTTAKCLYFAPRSLIGP